MSARHLFLGPLALGALLAAVSPARAETLNCALLTPEDVTGLLGGPVVEKQAGGACTWAATTGKKKVIASTMRATGAPAVSAFTGARKNASRQGSGKVVDEPGMGDRAFTVRTEYGVALVAIKKGRLLQLQYWAEAPGTPEHVEAFRPVARKALAAFGAVETPPTPTASKPAPSSSTARR
jgi:hypothetical protein